MSLKDRLKSVQKTTITKTKQQQEEVQHQYYANSETANSVDSLGALDTLLFDDDLNSIFVSGAKNIYVERNGKIHKSTSTFRDNIQLENIIKKNAQNIGIELSENCYCFKFAHELGVNVSATLPPLSNVATMFLKVYKDKHATFQALLEDLVISKEISLILEALCTLKKNILIAGDKNSLKTTLLSAMAKNIPTNNRAIIIDSENEVKIEKHNYTNYDFSKILDENQKNNLLNAIVDSSSDKIIVNSEDDKLLFNIIEKIQKGYNGVITTIKAKTAQESIFEMTKIILKNMPSIDFERAQEIVLNSFDVVIFVKKDDFGRRKIVSISQTNSISLNNSIKEIFNLDCTNEHKSTGVIPNFFDDIKNSSLPINENIFNETYKHTYYNNPEMDKIAKMTKKGANIDILKKFKKDLPTIDDENQENEVEENIVEDENISQVETGGLKAEIIDNLNNADALNNANSIEFMKKAQEKFEQMKKNVQNQEAFVLEQPLFEENQNEIQE